MSDRSVKPATEKARAVGNNTQCECINVAFECCRNLFRHNTFVKSGHTYCTEEKLGSKKLWRTPQSEFWQTKSLANYCYRTDVITLKVGEKTLANFYRFAKVFYRKVFLPYGTFLCSVFWFLSTHMGPKSLKLHELKLFIVHITLFMSFSDTIAVSVLVS